MSMLLNAAKDRLFEACEIGNLEKFKKILNNKTFNIDIDKNINDCFVTACTNNHINIVEYLDTNFSDKLDKEVFFKRFNLFSKICAKGSDAIVDYALEKIKDESFKNKNYSLSDLSQVLNEGYVAACGKCQLKVINQLENFQISKFNIYLKEGFLTTLLQKNSNDATKRLDCINHFLYDLKLPVDEKLKEKLKEYPSGETIFIEALGMGYKRDLFFKINDSLVEDDTCKLKKNKI